MRECSLLYYELPTLTNAVNRFCNATTNLCNLLKKEYSIRVKYPMSTTLKAHLKFVTMIAKEAAPSTYDILANRQAHWLKIHVPKTPKITEQHARLLTKEDIMKFKLDFILDNLKNYNEVAVPLNFGN